MTSNDRQEYLERLTYLNQEFQHTGCEDWIHEMADDILCEILEGLGYVDIVESYREIPKHYN